MGTAFQRESPSQHCDSFRADTHVSGNGQPHIKFPAIFSDFLSLRSYRIAM